MYKHTDTGSQAICTVTWDPLNADDGWPLVLSRQHDKTFWKIRHIHYVVVDIDIVSVRRNAVATAQQKFIHFESFPHKQM